MKSGSFTKVNLTETEGKVGEFSCSATDKDMKVSSKMIRLKVEGLISGQMGILSWVFGNKENLSHLQNRKL